MGKEISTRKKRTTRKQGRKVVLEGGGRLQTSPSEQIPDTPPNAVPESWDRIVSTLMESHSLNHREENFVAHYLNTGNAVESARRAGYKDARSSGKDLMSRGPIRAAIDSAKRIMLAKLYTNSQSINGALMKIALADHGPVQEALMIEGSVDEKLKRLRELPPEDRACIKSFNIHGKQGALSLAFESRNDALKTLSQNLGLSRGKEDTDSTTLIIEDVFYEEETVKDIGAGKMTALGGSLEAELSIFEDEEEQE
jgi:hypothetical protein